MILIDRDDVLALIRMHIPQDDFAAFYAAVEQLHRVDDDGFQATPEERGIVAPDGSY